MAKILIIDDSSTITQMLAAFLKKEGHDIITAGEGVTGVKMAQSEKPDVILLDIMLPKLNGFEVCNMLKMDSLYAHIKIIMFTAKASEETRSLSLETGADAYLTKDTDPDKILDAVNKLLNDA